MFNFHLFCREKRHVPVFLCSENLSDQEREARYICESFKAFTGVRVLLGAFSVLLAPFWTLLGAFFDALGCLLGALGRLFGASWVLLGRLLGPLAAS